MTKHAVTLFQRIQILDEIIKILKIHFNTNSNSHHLSIAKYVELSIYKHSKSFQEYYNFETLYHKIAITLSGTTCSIINEVTNPIYLHSKSNISLLYTMSATKIIEHINSFNRGRRRIYTSPPNNEHISTELSKVVEIIRGSVYGPLIVDSPEFKDLILKKITLSQYKSLDEFIDDINRVVDKNKNQYHFLNQNITISLSSLITYLSRAYEITTTIFDEKSTEPLEPPKTRSSTKKKRKRKDANATEDDTDDDRKICGLCSQTSSHITKQEVFMCTDCGHIYSTTNTTSFESIHETLCVYCYTKTTAVATALYYEENKSKMFTEKWITCALCSKVYHQTCVLYNSTTLGSINHKFVCPFCILLDKDESRVDLLYSKTCQLSIRYELPHTELSKFIQTQFDDSIYIRVLSTVTKTATTCKYIQKAIGVFQEISGVDVLIIVMFVHEFSGDDCPEANNKAVYISSLDCLQYYNSSETNLSYIKRLIQSYIQYTKISGFIKCFCALKYLFQPIFNVPTKPKKWNLPFFVKTVLYESPDINNVTPIYNTTTLPTSLPYLDNENWSKIVEMSIRDTKNKLLLQASKQDFIVCNYYESCKICEKNILDGISWINSGTGNTLCQECYKFIFEPTGYEKVTSGNEYPKIIVNTPPPLYSSIFNSELSYLRFCQANNYEFHELRLAKHSSMMTIYRILESKKL